MSGQQIGSFVGGVIGSFFGPVGYAIGAAVGGAIGAYVDPTIIKGPRLSDATAQTAADGIPIPFGFGTYPTAGNIIFASSLRERKKEDDGKGSGIVNVTYHYFRSYAIGICQGVRQETGLYEPIAGILQVKRNGKVVYNALPNATSEERAQNGKFMEKARFYLGGETQMPSAMMEAFKGVGNVPAYRGLAYMEVEDEELTDMGGAIPQYEFVVTTDGEVTPVAEEIEPLLLGQSGRIWQENAPEMRDPRIDGVLYEYGFSLVSGSGPGGITWRDTIEEAISDYEAVSGPIIDNADLMGWSAVYYGIGPEGTDPTAPWDDMSSIPWETKDVLGLIFSRYRAVEEEFFIPINSAGFPNQACSLYIEPQWGHILGGDTSEHVFVNATIINAAFGEFGNDSIWSCYDGDTYNEDGLAVYHGFAIACRPKLTCQQPLPQGAVLIPDAPGYYVLPDGSVGGGTVCEEVTGTFRQLANLQLDGFDIDQMPLGPALSNTDPDYLNEAFWTAAYNQAVSNGTIPPGYLYGVNYPVGSSVACLCVASTESIARDLIPVAQIVAAICKRAGLTEDDFDVSSITDLVDGFKVATEGSGESFINPLMNGFFFDAGEWDDKIWFIKRGQDVLGELGWDDLCEQEGSAISETELQEVELLRKVNIKAIDPDAGFNITTQTAERRTTLIRAKGEQTTEIPVVIDHDTQARMADKKMKVGWSEVRRFGFGIPYIFPQYTVTDVVGLTDKKGRRQRIRLMEMGEEEGRIQIKEAMLDRQSSYTSNVQGLIHQPPTNTSPGLIGPSNFIALNLPSLRTSDNVPGMYIGTHGYLSGWTGAAILLSVDDGVSYQKVADLTDAASMGYITAAIDEDDEPIPVHMLSGTLSSITVDQLANRMNGFAIETDGVAEVGQFQTATPTTPPDYDLTDVIRGALNTTPASHANGDPFVMVETLTFLKLDISLAGRTLKFKAVSYGTSPDDAAVYEVVFNPLFTTVVIEAYTNESGSIYRDQANSIYYRIS